MVAKVWCRFRFFVFWPWIQLLSQQIFQEAAHHITGSSLHIRRHMGVGIKRERCVGMSQDAGESLGIHTAGQSVGGKSYTPNILKGKVFCSHCGGSLHRQRNIRKKSDDVYLYHCLSRSRISKDSCPGATIREDVLLDMLADMLQEALNTALGKYTLSLAEQPQQAAERAELREKITSRKQEIQRLRGIVRSLYENLIQGVLTKDEYFDYKEKYENKIADIALEVEQLEDGLRTMDEQIEQYRALAQDAESIKTDRELTTALIERLIDRIEVSHDKQITVYYRFQSEFENYVEVLKQCRNM